MKRQWFHRDASPRLVERFELPLAGGNPGVADFLWNHIGSPRGSEEHGMETMKIHVLERALTAACIIAAIAVVWWGFKILSA